MRKISEVLRLAGQGLSYRQIGQGVGISASTAEDQEALLRLLDDPSFAFQTQIFQAVWGCRRPVN